MGAWPRWHAVVWLPIRRTLHRPKEKKRKEKTALPVAATVSDSTAGHMCRPNNRWSARSICRLLFVHCLLTRYCLPLLLAATACRYCMPLLLAAHALVACAPGRRHALRIAHPHGLAAAALFGGPRLAAAEAAALGRCRLLLLLLLLLLLQRLRRLRRLLALPCCWWWP